MKKTVLMMLLLLVLSSCNNKDTSIFDDAFKMIDISDNITDDIILKDSIAIDDKVVYICYAFDNDAIDDDGIIYPDVYDDRVVNIKIRLTYDNKTQEYDYGNVTIKSMEFICSEAAKSITIPNITSNDITLPTSIGKVKLRWNSSNPLVMTKTGECKYVTSDTIVTLNCIYSIKTIDNKYELEKDYQITVKPWDDNTKIEKVLQTIQLENDVIYDISLPTKFDFDLSGTWNSSNPSVIDNLGRVNRQSEDVYVTLTLTIRASNNDYQASYNVKVLKINKVDGEMDFYKHILVNRAKDLDNNNMTDLIYNNVTGRIELKEGKLSGSYESPVYNTNDFYRIVGSFSCITNENATCELEYSVRVNGNWSKYFSYGEFGLGRNNVYYNQYDKDVQMDTDIIMTLDNKLGDGMKYRFTLRRKNQSVESPKLSLVATVFFIKDYKYNVDLEGLPTSVDWDVPKLYQHDVPTIGNQICSATTTTMLLKFAGFSFTDKGYRYEHEYMSHMVADTGHNNPTYGNWSYNMMAAGAFGVNAYVGKYYSWDEIKYHLANYGPIGSSISGQFGSYYTNGHLIVIRGYREENGKTTVICNDPNIKGVYYEVPLETYLECMGSVVYILEFNGKEIIK